MTEQNLSANEFGVTPDMIEKAFDADFTKSLDEQFAGRSVQGTVVKGIITSIDKGDAVVDIGMKAEGRVDLKEFTPRGSEAVEVNVGDTVDVFVESIDDRNGEARVSREKARREEALVELEKKHASGEKVEGIIFGRVKGGFAVDVMGVLAFMPGSQLDARPIKDVEPFMNIPQEMSILKLDKNRGNIIVSRRAVMDDVSDEVRDEVLQNMEEGKVVEGVVKNITDYGAFIDLGGVDGLLHITDIAWHRISHPSEVLTVGQKLEVQVTRFDAKNKRVSLGLKQMANDPWATVSDAFPIGAKVVGKVTNLTDYGAFIELAPGVEGLIHVSEMSWTRKNLHPSKLMEVSSDVDVIVLEIDHDKRRISLGYKQCQDNPWQTFAKTHKEGDEVEGTVRSVTDFGVFVGLTDDIDGLIHVSDISWEESGEEALADYKKGQTVKAKIIALDPAKERVALGLKQMADDPVGNFISTQKKGDSVNVTVTDVTNDGITVSPAENVEVFIKKRELSTERDEQDPMRFKKGEEIEVKIVNLSTRDRKIEMSLRAKQVADERQAVAEYAGKEEGAATLADALGDALKGAAKKDDAE